MDLRRKNREQPNQPPVLPRTIPLPGLGPEAGEAQRLAASLPKRLKAFAYRSMSEVFWVIFLGGTGTGKSTLFNGLCGRSLSETGLERPKTRGALVYAHRSHSLGHGLPFADYPLERRSSEDPEFRPAAGNQGHVLLLDHDRDALSDLVLVDTPDLDSVEEANRRIARDLYLLADIVVFVASQEKYADDVPYRCLERVIREGTSTFFLLNKAQDHTVEDDVLDLLKSKGVPLDRERAWLIPHLLRSPEGRIHDQEGFQALRDSLYRETRGEQGRRRRGTLRAQSAQRLNGDLRRLIALLGRERREADDWFRALDTRFQDALQDLLQEEQQRFSANSRPVIQREIRRLFAGFDLLARPRRAIQAVFLVPLRLLGFRGTPRGRSRDDDLARVRKTTDKRPIQATLDRLNRRILEDLSPADEDSPLYRRLPDPDLQLREEEIEVHLQKEQERLYAWLEERFQVLAQELPRGKRWGIYSTSVLWGLLIVSFEIAAGGGFSLLDAALDSAVAPFLTKGSVELFAYREIQKIARELAKRYEKGLISLVERQRDRYRRCLVSLLPSPEILEGLERCERWLRDQPTGRQP